MTTENQSVCNEDTLVTVGVAVYNVEETLLRRCLSSLVPLSYDGMEIILVDDGSTDGCPAILDSYANEHNSVQVIHTDNQGLSGARNVVIDHAHGAWLMFVDGDDYVPSGFLEKMTGLLSNRNDTDILFFGYKSSWDISEAIEPTSGDGSITYAPDPFALAKSIVGNNEFQFGREDSVKFGSSWGKFFRRGFIEDHNCRFTLGVNKSQDRVFLTEVLSYKPRLMIADILGYVYVSNMDSVTRRHNTTMQAKLAHTYEVTEQKIREFYQGQELEEMLEALVQMRTVFMYDVLDTTYLCPTGNPNYHHEFKEFKEYVQNYFDCIDAVDLKLIYGVRNKYLLYCLKHRLYRPAYYGSMVMMDAYLLMNRRNK